MDRRSFVIGTTALAAAGPAFAQDVFPSHAITILNAFPPGGANDIAAAHRFFRGGYWHDLHTGLLAHFSGELLPILFRRTVYFDLGERTHR